MKLADTDVDVRVFTFHEGLLSAVAHDLELRVLHVDVELDAERITVRIDPRDLRVVHAMRDGAALPGALSEKDVRQIEANIAKDVLEVARYPDIRCTLLRPAPTGDTLRAEASLTLHGVTRTLPFEARRAGDDWRAELVVQQPDFGIRPYRALFGAIQVRAEVRVVIRVRAAAVDAIS